MGEHLATPGCECKRCRAVFDEWTEQAKGFQRWFDGLSDGQLAHYFGLERPLLLWEGDNA